MPKEKYIYRLSFADDDEQSCDKVCATEFFFTSLSAIYETFTPEQIGCKVARLWNCKITPENPYIGSKCKITKELLSSKRISKNRQK